MRLAYFSPLNPIASGISDYSEELLMSLGAYADITLVVDGYEPSNPELRNRFRIVQESAYDSAEFDLKLYHLGNSPAHAAIYRRALREPGVIVLHDLVLHHLVAWMTLEHGDRAGYIHIMREIYGARGAEIAEREALGLEGLDRFAYPLVEHVLKNARGVIAHSRYVCDYVERAVPHVPVAQIPHELPMAAPIPQAQARAQLGLPQDALLAGSFGNLAPSKRVSVLLEAFAQVRDSIPNARLLFIGESSNEFDVTSLVEMFGLGDAVQITGRADFETFQTYMAAVDVCVNLRYPTAGETSGAVLRMMAQAKPVIVSRVGWFAELPNDIVAHVDADETETQLLRVTLQRLLGDAALRAALGRNARSYIEQVCTVEDAARAYVDFLEDVAARRASNRSYQGAWNQSVLKPSRLAVQFNRKKPSKDLIPEPTEQLADWKLEVARACAACSIKDDRELRAVSQAIVDLGW